MSGPAPRASILLPNFNNGRQSSRSGDHDFLGNLLQSLYDTLHDEPAPFEIILYDDGSNDDSLDTLRAWAQRSWPDGRPFFAQVIERPHCGYLSRTANVLCKAATGEVLVRLDGDIVCLTPHWVSKMMQVFDQGPPTLGIIGPKQLAPDLRIHAFGDWLLHPNGYIHVAGGLDRFAVRAAMEVDTIMGCFHCMKKAVYDDVGGYDENFLRGQTEDLSLRARLKGWRCWAVPSFEFVHLHGLRKSRETEADTRQGIAKGLKTFEDKWGFDRIAPDLDEVARRYRGTSLLWNARWFAAGCEEALDPPPEGLRIEQSEWVRYANDQALRRRIDFRVAVALKVVQETGKPKLAGVVGCGAGLVPHLLAMQGVTCVGTDRHQGHIDLARSCVKNQKYPGSGATPGAGAPRYERQTDARKLALADGEVDLLLLFDQLERHPNPVALLREAGRVLEPGKVLAIVSQRKAVREDGPGEFEHRYRWAELVTQVQVCGWQVLGPSRDEPNPDMYLVAKNTTRR